MAMLIGWTEAGKGDICVNDANHVIGTGHPLISEVVTTLFTDAAQEPGDPVPESVPLRGWWGDSYHTTTDGSVGSKLWQLPWIRSPSVRELYAVQWAEDAMQWLINTQRVASISATAAHRSVDWLDLRVILRVDKDTAHTLLFSIPTTGG